MRYTDEAIEPERRELIEQMQRVSDLLCNALEGGSNYWYQIAMYSIQVIGTSWAGYTATYTYYSGTKPPDIDAVKCVAGDFQLVEDYRVIKSSSRNENPSPAPVTRTHMGRLQRRGRMTVRKKLPKWSPETLLELNQVIEHLWGARDNQLWYEDAEGLDDDLQHKLDPHIDGIMSLIKEIKATL